MSEEMRYTDKIFLVDSPKRTRGFYDDLFRKAIQQARAEVLAACVADVDAALAIFMENKGRSKDEKLLVGGVCLAIKNRLGQLQPAAKHLKELLQKERERIWEAAIKIVRSRDGACPTNIAVELEKARAKEKP